MTPTIRELKAMSDVELAYRHSQAVEHIEAIGNDRTRIVESVGWKVMLGDIQAVQRMRELGVKA